MTRKEIVAMILAGGQGSRLGVLTQNVANRQFFMVENTVLLTLH